MLSKNNKILIGCLALLLAMSVGYALFSDTITVSGTATAKGEFNISGSCQAGIPAELVSGVKAVYGMSEIEEHGYKNDSCSFDATGNTGTINVDFDYPGAKRFFVVKLTNDGDIAAKMGELDYTANICWDSNDSGTYEANECSATNPDSMGWGYISLIAEPTPVGVQIGKDGSIIPIDKITQEQGMLFQDADGNFFLEPNNSAYFVIPTLLNADLGTDDGGKFMLKTDISFSFPFIQTQ